MKWVEKLFFKDNLDKFKIETLVRMKFFFLFGIFVLLFFYVMNIRWESGIAVKEDYIFGKDYGKVYSKDSSFNKAIGLVKLPQLKTFEKIFFYKGEQYDQAPNLTFFDLLIFITLLYFLFKFTDNAMKLGPFHIKTIQFLKWSSIVSFMAFFIKTLLSIYIEFRVASITNHNYRLDSAEYSGVYWVYIASIYAFIVNIFNYGRKLQADADLTV